VSGLQRPIKVCAEALGMELVNVFEEMQVAFFWTW